MKTLNQWLDEYAQSHQNKINKTIHYIFVPLIMFSLIGILLSISVWLMWVVVIISLIFYAKLSLKLSLYMLVITLIMIVILYQLPHLFWVSFAIFIIGWIFQFIGHKLEGKKPSFFKDLQFLLISPLWVLNHILSKCNHNK
ncbi:Mpo1 family 2-hydroxy fatty acid dioxygenase [Cysteiniphilum halobium]|uniref:Mpo1 family 2-hydroxy fatty acid dioxygenase n=1 Tax=Cysteiniphilum halobium TaxID=2219059 RepID=UPI000E64CAA6|nr:Mpo1-like protein [Cysteiniphilum halobium]